MQGRIQRLVIGGVFVLRVMYMHVGADLRALSKLKYKNNVQTRFNPSDVIILTDNFYPIKSVASNCVNSWLSSSDCSSHVCYFTIINNYAKLYSKIMSSSVTSSGQMTQQPATTDKRISPTYSAGSSRELMPELPQLEGYDGLTGKCACGLVIVKRQPLGLITWFWEQRNSRTRNLWIVFSWSCCTTSTSGTKWNTPSHGVSPVSVIKYVKCRKSVCCRKCTPANNTIL